MARIVKADINVGTYLVINPKSQANYKLTDNICEIVKIHPTNSAYFGIQMPGSKDGNDLDGFLPAAQRYEGMWFNIDSINEMFELAPSNIIPIRHKISFDSVILPNHKKEQIIHAMKQIDFSDLIFVEWGFAKTFEKGKGISMLFYGPPGTGKTLMAQAIAHKLDYSLKIISNADIQSSVPGEAERNIRKYFKENKGKNSVLLFDECDSLIFSRASVGAILGAQINELLSQLERFEGITIFTTNRLGTLDEAVNRRLSVKIEFAMPSVTERVAIWQRMFPAEAPLDGDIDWKKLAKYPIAGGHIKNAVLRAAREAAVADMEDKHKTITMAHLLKGLKAEVEATKEFEKAKHQWEGRYRGVSGLSHDGGKLPVEKQSVKDYQKSVAEMKEG